MPRNFLANDAVTSFHREELVDAIRDDLALLRCINEERVHISLHDAEVLKTEDLQEPWEIPLVRL